MREGLAGNLRGGFFLIQIHVAELANVFVLKLFLE